MMRKLRARCWLWLVLCASAGTGCHAAFTTKAPSGFVELDEHGGRYAFRATTPDGLVVAAREVDHEPEGTLDFWVRAVENTLRTRGGYALLEVREITIAGGYPGKQLRFGHDEVNRPHLYYVTLVVTGGVIYVLEVGGAKPLVEAHEHAIAEWVQSFRAERCAPFPFAFACSTLTASDAPAAPTPPESPTAAPTAKPPAPAPIAPTPAPPTAPTPAPPTPAPAPGAKS